MTGAEGEAVKLPVPAGIKAGLVLAVGIGDADDKGYDAEVLRRAAGLATRACQLKHRLRPMRGLRTDRTAQTIIAGHAFMQNIRRGNYELYRAARRALESSRADVGDLRCYRCDRCGWCDRRSGAGSVSPRLPSGSLCIDPLTECVTMTSPATAARHGHGPTDVCTGRGRCRHDIAAREGDLGSRIGATCRPQLDSCRFLMWPSRWRGCPATAGAGPDGDHGRLRSTDVDGRRVGQPLRPGRG